MFLQPDWTSLIQLINFVIFFAILNVIFLRPVGRAILERRAYINSVTADYDRFQTEGNALRREAEGVRAAARRDAEQVLAKARAEASDGAADLAAQYSARAAEIVEGAHRTSDAELELARASEEKLASALAGAMLDRTLGEAAP